MGNVYGDPSFLHLVLCLDVSQFLGVLYSDDYLSMVQPIRLWFAQTKAFNWAFSLISSAKALSYPSILRCRNTDFPKSKIHFHKKVIS